MLKSCPVVIKLGKNFLAIEASAARTFLPTFFYNGKVNSMISCDKLVSVFISFYFLNFFTFFP